jgi:hypothetical protein
LLSEDDVLVARMWTQVKSEKHALGRTDTVRVDQLKREMLEEVEAAGVATDREMPGDPSATKARPADSAPTAEDA